jgi:hypothetical protein
MSFVDLILLIGRTNQMNDLRASLAVLLRHYAGLSTCIPAHWSACAPSSSRDIGLIVAKCGQTAVDKAIDELPEGGMAVGRPALTHEIRLA